jgi:tetratricopeptide (TPR) repeat protein
MADEQERDKQIALGERLYNQGNVPAAAASFRLAVGADPESPQAHAQLAWCLAAIEQAHEAIDHLRIAARLDPNSGKVLESLATQLVRIGDFSKAEAAFRGALDLKPDSVTSLCGIVSCRRLTLGDLPLVERLSSAAHETRRPEKQRAQLFRAAGKAYDDLADYEAAIRHFDESNRISETMAERARQTFGAEELERYTDLLIDVFTADRFKEPLGAGSDSELPVLIVGMIRSGTTLLDQILIRHPEVASAGELNYWTGPGPGTLMRELLSGKIDRSKATSVCSEYRLLLRKFGPAHERVIDKMPMNFLGLGLIHLLFPKARIIHTRRNPLDTCLSIYVTDLGWPRANFAVSRRNIAFMYRQYARLMEHWRLVLPPDRFLEVDYEELVADQEREVKRVVKFLGLEWDPACPRAAGTDSVVTTPSAWQARQPVYSSSIGRWRNYEPWLGEIKEFMP